MNKRLRVEADYNISERKRVKQTICNNQEKSLLSLFHQFHYPGQILSSRNDFEPLHFSFPSFSPNNSSINSNIEAQHYSLFQNDLNKRVDKVITSSHVKDTRNNMDNIGSIMISDDEVPDEDDDQSLTRFFDELDDSFPILQEDDYQNSAYSNTPITTTMQCRNTKMCVDQKSVSLKDALPTASRQGQLGVYFPAMLQNETRFSPDFTSLKGALLSSRESQRDIQTWDKLMGLKSCHSRTMCKSALSRKKVLAEFKKGLMLLINTNEVTQT